MEVIKKKQVGRYVATDPRWELVNRIKSSTHFSSSPRLKQLLIYVADCAIREAPEDATEQQIGVRVFNRSPGYNSSDDSIVRSQARLLRIKLAAYFASDGVEEPLLLEVPKGHYLPVFQTAAARAEQIGESVSVHFGRRPALLTTEDATAQTSVIDPSRASTTPSSPIGLWIRAHWAQLGLALVVLLAAVAGAYWLGRSAATPSVTSVDQLWKPFLSGEPPLLIYSNARFVGDSANGLRYATDADTPRPPDTEYVESYSGIGEVSAVHDLTALFDARHSSFILKRSLLVTWDEAEKRNLVFIGSVAENPALKILPITQDFTHKVAPQGAGIVNHRPGPGEDAFYTRPEHPLTSDYAIIALRTGFQSGRKILIFSGMTTLGTQAAVEFGSTPENVTELIRRAGTNKDGSVRPFESVVQTTISGGVPLNTHLVAFHQR